MGFNFGQKQHSEQNDELKALAAQIETISQQLANSNHGKEFSTINQKLSFLYESIKAMQQDMRASHEKMQVQQNELKKSIDLLQAKPQTEPTGQKDITDVKNTLHDMVSIYKEQVEVFKKQNMFLQQKLSEIEQRLGDLEK